jgi:hypothetical protein
MLRQFFGQLRVVAPSARRPAVKRWKGRAAKSLEGIEETIASRQAVGGAHIIASVSLKPGGDGLAKTLNAPAPEFPPLSNHDSLSASTFWTCTKGTVAPIALK